MAKRGRKVKRIAIFLCAVPLALSLACSAAHTSAETAPSFPEDVEFVVVDELPAEAESADEQQAYCYVSAAFYEGGTPMRSVPVVLYSGDQALFSALTDASGRVACGALPQGADLLVVASPEAEEDASAVILLLPAKSAESAALLRTNAVALEPTGELDGSPCLNVVFILGGSTSAAGPQLPFAELSVERRVSLKLS